MNTVEENLAQLMKEGIDDYPFQRLKQAVCGLLLDTYSHTPYKDGMMREHLHSWHYVISRMDNNPENAEIMLRLIPIEEMHKFVEFESARLLNDEKHAKLYGRAMSELFIFCMKNHRLP